MRLSSGAEHVDLTTVNLYDPSWYATGDPHSAWRQLRAEQPVYWQQLPDGRGFWVLTRHADVCRVLRSFRDFTSEDGNLLTTLGQRDIAGGKMLAVTDPPRHTAIKRQIIGCFTPATVAAMEPQIRLLARRMFVPGLDGQVFDLAAQTAVFPIAITALLMGIDPAHWHRLRTFAYVAIADQDPDVTSGRRDHALEWSHSEIFSYFAGELANKPAARADLIGAIANATVDGCPLSQQEMLFNSYSVLLGATVTTSHAANVAVLALAENPGADERWRATGCTDTLVEEVLRWSSPANHFLRHATRSIEIAGTTIRAGDPVTVWLGAANRDEEVFERPYDFDVNRDPRAHIAFGVGAHRCIGAPLARLALRVFAEETRDLVESFEIAGPVDHLASNFIAGIKRLPVRVRLKRNGATALAGLTPLNDDAGERGQRWERAITR
ncbi:cytochrome P450 [Micromonospora noduli]|uniref:cytochrome P450 n=1 Tax=Micromonospora noduli TaxID=709876 RepID=UPI000DBFEAED|nr:cytochrome P450 [Micromonospora noduli]RAO12508.1 Linalool 8-monooxygenase [Micromonospora noduli]